MPTATKSGVLASTDVRMPMINGEVSIPKKQRENGEVPIPKKQRENGETQDPRPDDDDDDDDDDDNEAQDGATTVDTSLSENALVKIVNKAVKSSLVKTIKGKMFTELFDDTSKEPHSRYLPDLDENYDYTEKCLICNKDDTKEELIFPCICRHKRQQIHIDCLLDNLGLSSVGHCIYCLFAFKFERKVKPMIQWTRNLKALTNMLCAIISIIIWILIGIGIIFLYKNDVKTLYFERDIERELKIAKTFFSAILITEAIGYFFITGLLVKKVRKYWSFWYESNVIWELRTYKGERIS